MGMEISDSMSVEDLSDDVLHHIFALAGPEAVLYSVYGVCRRWRKVAMDARLWSRVCVSFDETPDRPWEPQTRPLGGGALWLRIVEKKRGAGAMRRVLLRAPCLRRLELSLKLRPPEDLLNALGAACDVPIQELAMLRVPKELALPLIRAQADTLRALEWRQPKQDLRIADTEDYIYSDGDGMPYMPDDVWKTLARLSLRELVVDWTWSTGMLAHWWWSTEPWVARHAAQCGYSYSEDVNEVMSTELTKFHLHLTEERNDSLQRWQRTVAWPLLRANAAHLRELHLRLAPLPSLEGLSFPSLRVVTVPLKMDLRPLLGCRALRDVTLLGDEAYHTCDATGDGTRKSVSFLNACAHPDSGLPLEALGLEGFSKYSTPQLPGAAAKLTSLRELRFIKCDFRGCDGSFYALAKALGKLGELRRLEVGYATDIPLGALKRLGAAMPPTLRWLRLDIYHECERQEAEIREVVAAHPGLHVVRTSPTMADYRQLCPDRCETLHAGRCGAKIVANHSNLVADPPQGQATGRGGRSRRPSRGRGGRGRNVDCAECASVLRYQRTSLTEVDSTASSSSQAPQDNPDDPEEESEDSAHPSCCRAHSRDEWF
ncbi:uncharacterized protein LOC117647802 isoform X2 [Thrips palmi]|uniref:Uncharacterized protein LOC117647802 isoform X2 n=1 Tax=Thrips palmi TaxID=161013 RepID=A0A6P8YZL4_THRPL|nr:uncharacterized protein LOC117647802 isoform X2 [Thrips palmi]